MRKKLPALENMLGDFAPKLVELTDRVLFGDVWERKELSKRDRSLITVATLVALNRPEQLRFHLNKTLENGLKKVEFIELITHLAFYAGWPCSMTAITVAKEVFSQSQTPGRSE
jgi:4-carboxymuconolactone decarboxylase